MRTLKGASVDATRIGECIYFSKRDLARDAGFEWQRAKEWLVNSCGQWVQRLLPGDNQAKLFELDRSDYREQLYRAHPSSYQGLIQDIHNSRHNSVHNGLSTRLTPRKS